MGKKFGKGGDDSHKQYEQGVLPMTNTSGTKRCHHGHPVLKLGKGEIVGGSCRSPRLGYDIYVGLDWEMAYHPKAFPWSTPRVEMLHYPIQDMHAPGEVKLFTEMVEWLCTQLQEGKKIHIGCIGGHGRTGILLSAIVAKLGTKDAIQWVRQHHCKKAVESAEQVTYLMTHFGVSKVSPAKGSDDSPLNKFFTDGWGEPQETSRPSHIQGVNTSGNLDLRSKRTYTPTKSKKSIWTETI